MKILKVTSTTKLYFALDVQLINFLFEQKIFCSQDIYIFVIL